MKKLSETYKELEIAFTFPIEIKDDNGKMTYCEASDGYWWRAEYDTNGNETYWEPSDGYWWKREYDSNGNETYCESSEGFWRRYEYDADGKVTYCEDSYGDKNGTPRSQSCDGKVIEVDGKKYQLWEL